MMPYADYEKQKANARANYARNKEKRKEQMKKYREENRERCNSLTAASKRRRREYINEYERTKYHSDPQYALKKRLRRRMKLALAKGWKTGSAVRDLGCSIDFFKEYIEGLWAEGMSWDNTTEWHLDHIKPLDSFDLTDEVQFKEACHYTNIQPLWAMDNLRKGNLC